MAVCSRCKAKLPEGASFCPSCGKKQASEKKKALKRANGTGTVYKLSGRRRRPWVAAKSKVIIGYYEKKTDALEALEKVSGKSLTERYNMTFEDVFYEWREEHFRTLESASGKRQYNRSFAIFSTLHDRKFRDLRTADFQSVIDQYSQMSYSLISKHKQLLTQMSQWAIREEIITTNFASFIQLPKEQKKEKEVFTDEDIRKLSEDDSESAMIVLMLIYTGMRIGELFSLPVSDWHETYVIGGEKTVAGRNRIIPIRSEGRKYFSYFAENASGDLLLSAYSGHTEMNQFRIKDYYPLLEKLGIERKTPHCTRHTYASWAVKQGMQPEVLQKILGHVKYSTTAEIYVHSDIDQLVSAVDNC